MEIVFDKGQYIEENKSVEGEVVLGEHKLFLRDDGEEIASTFIPLEKIEKIKKISSGVEFYVRPSLTLLYKAQVKVARSQVAKLIECLVMARGFKKKFLRNEWVDASG